MNELTQLFNEFLQTYEDNKKVTAGFSAFLKSKGVTYDADAKKMVANYNNELKDKVPEKEGISDEQKIANANKVTSNEFPASDSNEFPASDSNEFPASDSNQDFVKEFADANREARDDANREAIDNANKVASNDGGKLPSPTDGHPEDTPNNTTPEAAVKAHNLELIQENTKLKEGFRQFTKDMASLKKDYESYQAVSNENAKLKEDNRLAKELAMGQKWITADCVNSKHFTAYAMPNTNDIKNGLVYIIDGQDRISFHKFEDINIAYDVDTNTVFSIL